MGNDSGSLKGRVSASTWVECRICQEEDRARNMEVPCACSGSLKIGYVFLAPQYAHSKCLRPWSKKKGDTMCELCYQRYKPKRGHQLDERTSRHLDVTSNMAAILCLEMDSINQYDLPIKAKDI